MLFIVVLLYCFDCAAKHYLAKIYSAKLTNSFASVDVKGEARNVPTYGLKFS